MFAQNIAGDLHQPSKPADSHERRFAAVVAQRPGMPRIAGTGIVKHAAEQRAVGLVGDELGPSLVALVFVIIDVAIATIQIALGGEFKHYRMDVRKHNRPISRNFALPNSLLATLDLPKSACRT